MAEEELDLDRWLFKHVSWMINETCQYFDTREMLMLCHTVAVMNLERTMRKVGAPQGGKAPSPKAGTNSKTSK